MLPLAKLGKFYFGFIYCFSFSMFNYLIQCQKVYLEMYVP